VYIAESARREMDTVRSSAHLNAKQMQDETQTAQPEKILDRARIHAEKVQTFLTRMNTVHLSRLIRSGRESETVSASIKEFSDREILDPENEVRSALPRVYRLRSGDQMMKVCTACTILYRIFPENQE